jgi:serine/threonine protein kinase
VRPEDDPQLVTVKVIDAPTDVSRFCECLTMTGSALDSLRHPAVAAILNVGITGDGHAFVVAPYIPSLSLRNYVNGRSTDVASRAKLAGRLCSAVADLHDAGVVHGSLKPTNVIVLGSTDGPRPILLDTGTVTAIEYGLIGASRATPERDCRELHRLLGDVLGDLTGIIGGTESVAVLADMFSRDAN